MKVAIFDTHNFEKEFLLAAAGTDEDLTFFQTRLGENTVSLCEGFDVISVFVNDVVNRTVIEGLSRAGVRHIALRSAGFNHVDILAAKELGMTVTNVPEYSPYAVAEHTIALILALNRKIALAQRRISDLNFSLDGLVGFDLHGKTVGLVGVGRIGAVVAHILNGFGCRLLVSDPTPAQEFSFPVQYTSLETLCKEADIISLHLPLNEQTFHIINAERLSVMKPKAMLINTSRGGLVDTKAVINSLKSGRLGYFGIDVYEEESGLFFEDHSAENALEDEVISRLMTFKNVLITSHQAFLTDTALENIATTTFKNIHAVHAGEPCENML